jgi:hypothetical protein
MHSLATVIVHPSRVFDPTMFARLDNAGSIMKSAVSKRTAVYDEISFVSSAGISEDYPKMETIWVIRWPGWHK